jgi:succinoglycan biosynthesis transport protein ExoP
LCICGQWLMMNSVNKTPTTETASAQETVDLRALMRPLRRWKWVVVLIAVIASAGTYFLSSRLPKHYVSSTRVYVEVVDPAAAVESPQLSTTPTAQDMQDLASLFTAQAVTAAVDKKLALPIGSAKAGSVSVTPLEGTNSTPTSFLVVTATADSGSLAARLANTYVAEFLAARRSAQAAEATSYANATRQELGTLLNTPANAAQRQALITQESQLKTLALNPSAGAEQTNPAVVPSSPSSPKPVRNAILAGLVGLLLGVGLAFGLELLDRRLLRISDVEKMYRMPVLTVLPHTRKPVLMRDGYAAIPADFIEPMRSLRVSLELAFGDRRQRTLLVASAVPGEGKSTVVRDLALVYAEAGMSVLIIDADLRQPSIARILGVEPETKSLLWPQPGLAQVLRNEVSLAAAALPILRFGIPTRTPSVNTNGTREPPSVGGPRQGSIELLDYGERVANPVALLASAAMGSTLAAAAGRYDTIIVDSAPLLAVADTVPLLGMVDGVVLVARLGLSTRESADRLWALLERVPAGNLMGVVANGMRGTYLDGGYGSYGYGYGDQVFTAPAGAVTPEVPPAAR